MVAGQTEGIAQAALAPCNTQAQKAENTLPNEKVDCLGMVWEPEEVDKLLPKHDLSKQGIEVLIDWVGITYLEESVMTVLERFGLYGWMPTEHGWKGYKQGYIRGHVQIWYDGQPGQGVNVQISGKGCRELEARKIITDWPAWLSEQVTVGRFSRLDVAMDDRALKPEQGLLQKHAIEAAINESRIVSRYKEVNDYGKRSLLDASTTGWTRKFGSGLSETSMKIYDKVLEQGITESYHWMRCELVCRREKAHQLARVIAEFGLAGVASTIWGLLDFKEQGTHSQRDRWETCGWWLAFLGEVEKVRLTLRPVERTLDEAKQWLFRNVAPILAVVARAERMVGGNAQKFLEAMYKEGEARFKYKHLQMLGCVLVPPKMEFAMPAPVSPLFAPA